MQTFPTLTGLAFPLTREAIWNTLKQAAVSGKEVRVQPWSFPRWRYTLPFSILRSDSTNLELQTLAGFYNQMGGSAQFWLYNDPDDNTVTDQVFGAGDGVTTAFPLLRAFGGYTEPVFAPTITNIKIAGTPTAAYTLGTAGLVTFNSAPANAAALTWTGTFKWVCRFDDDSVSFEKFQDQRWNAKKLTFTTEKLTSS